VIRRPSLPHAVYRQSRETAKVSEARLGLAAHPLLQQGLRPCALPTPPNERHCERNEVQCGNLPLGAKDPLLGPYLPPSSRFFRSQPRSRGGSCPWGLLMREGFQGRGAETPFERGPNGVRHGSLCSAQTAHLTVRSATPQSVSSRSTNWRSYRSWYTPPRANKSL